MQRNHLSSKVHFSPLELTLIRMSKRTHPADHEIRASLVEIGVQSEIEKTSAQLIIQAEPLSADMVVSWTSLMQLFVNRHHETS